MWGIHTGSYVWETGFGAFLDELEPQHAE